MPILRYIHIFLILLCPYPASFSLDWKKLILEFCTLGERRNLSKETTLPPSTNGKTIGLLTSRRKEVMQLMDVAACQLEVH